MILPERVFGSSADDVDVPGARDRSDLLADPLAKGVGEPLGGVLGEVALLDDHEGDDRLPGRLIGSPDDGGLGGRLVRHEG